MADGHGGSRQPAKPAPVSGPGKYSKRTDGGPAQVLSAPSNLAYGEKQALLNQQRVQPMAGTTPTPNAPVQAQQSVPPGTSAQLPQFAGVGLDSPSQRPNEPITSGVNIGPGANSVNLPTAPNPAQGTGSMTALLQKYASTDTTGIMGQLMMAAAARGA